MVNCSKCGKPSDGWPDGTNNPQGEFCQDCWEEICDKDYWQHVITLDKAGVVWEDL